MPFWFFFFFSLPGDKELCFTLSNGSKAAVVEMSTRSH